jgi:hypothetical protein
MRVDARRTGAEPSSQILPALTIVDKPFAVS